MHRDVTGRDDGVPEGATPHALERNTRIPCDENIKLDRGGIAYLWEQQLLNTLAPATAG